MHLGNNPYSTWDVISEAGIHVDTEKIKSVLEWPLLKSVRGVQGFLGLTGYYRKFVRNCGKIAHPFTELLKKEKFQWSDEGEEAFHALQHALTEAPLLVMPDFSQECAIRCNASTGAVLMQNSRPLAYFSKGLADKTLAKSTYEKELLALVLAIQHWWPYLLGCKFTVFTDQRSLKHLLKQRLTTPDQQNWLAKFLGYDLK